MIIWSKPIFLSLTVSLIIKYTANNSSYEKCISFWNKDTRILSFLGEWRIECSPISQETGVQSKVESYLYHHLYLLFCCVLSIHALICLVLMALFCAAIRRDSISLLRFPFLSHVQVFSCEMLLISRLKRPWVCFSSHFCFFSYCRSVSLRVVCSVSGGCNQSFSALFYLVFGSLYQCFNAVFSTGKSSSSLFSWYI